MKFEYAFYAGVFLIALVVAPFSHALYTNPTTATAGLVLTTDQSSYTAGQTVTVTLTNNGNTAYQYDTGCSTPFSVFDPNGNTLVIDNPSVPICMLARLNTLQPGQSATLGTWGQSYYETNGTQLFASAGTYSVSFNGLTAQFSLAGNPSAGNPPSPPSANGYNVTVNLNAGWNMVSIPVYNFSTCAIYPMPTPIYNEQANSVSGQASSGPAIIIGRPYPIQPCTQGTQGVKIVQNNCSINSIWSYNDNYYPVAQADLQPNTGYWFNVAGACSITFTGNIATYASGYNQQLNPGWNLVGAPYSDSGATPFSSLDGSCSVAGGPWFYDSSTQTYQSVTSFVPGQAYWVNVNDYCSLESQTAMPPTPIVMPMTAQASAGSVISSAKAQATASATNPN
jgi:hypothetical protein